MEQLHNVALSEDRASVIILDQTLLPNREEYLELNTPEACWEAIHSLRVRGAPAIGIFAGYAIYVLSRPYAQLDHEEFARQFREQKAYLNSSRPTAVNLSWALERMEMVVTGNPGLRGGQLLTLLERECVSIHEEDIAMCRAIAEYGLSLLKPGDGVLTHCNAGPIATSQYGTALGPLLLGQEREYGLKVFADETRPLLQGARLTAYELYRAGVDVTLICDNMASMVMQNGWVQACFVGCDRIAANGDFANKIGTSGVAVLAKYYGVPFYTLGPTSTIDMSCPDGAHIPVEQRDPQEIKSKFYTEPMAPAQVKCFNPAFDVTDHTLLTAIVTERGICYPPFSESLKKLFE